MVKIGMKSIGNMHSGTHYNPSITYQKSYSSTYNGRATYLGIPICTPVSKSYLDDDEKIAVKYLESIVKKLGWGFVKSNITEYHKWRIKYRGKSVVVCELNGDLWVPKADEYGFEQYKMFGEFDHTSLMIDLKDDDAVRKAIEVRIKEIEDGVGRMPFFAMFAVNVWIIALLTGLSRSCGEIWVSVVCFFIGVIVTLFCYMFRRAT